MATTYTWHPGSVSVNARWTIPVTILPDELFSTWLIRAALAQGCDPLALTGYIWPKWRVWACDVDRGISLERLSLLSKEAGISAECFDNTTLKDINNKITHNNLKLKALSPWILAQGSRNRKRKGGLQYCPECLKKDKVPYFRLQWRMAWHTVCERCNCQLLDRCPNCKAVIEPHRLVATDKLITSCTSCQSDLRNTSSIVSNENLRKIQTIADNSIIAGCGLYNDHVLKTHEWFSVLRYFIALIRKACAMNNMGLVNFLNCCDIEINSELSPLTGLAFEMLPINERSLLLDAAYKLIQIKEDDFILYADDFKLNIQAFKESRQVLPEVIYGVIKSLPLKCYVRSDKKKSQHYRPCSRQAVMRKWALLQRKYHINN